MTRRDPMGTIPAFEVPEQDRRSGPKRARLAHHKPAWSRYRPKNPVKCDDCMAVLAETKGKGPHSMSARWKRKAGDDIQLLCIPHAQAQRERDKLPALPERRRA